MNADLLIQELTARLPELEWKINSLEAPLSINALPRGLFRVGPEISAALCITEIREDIQRLSRQKNGRSACYLASRVQQKIFVLVTFCNIQASSNKPKGRISFSLDKISTRQQWIQTLEEEFNRLIVQRDALAKSLEKLMLRRDGAEAILQLQAALGEMEKRLTLLKEKTSLNTT